MISAEKLLDSLGNLPDDLIAETEAIRSRKPVHWVRWTALAACLCLCIGLWFAFPGGAKSADNGAGTPMEEIGNVLEDIEQSTSSAGHLDAIVYSVGEDHITATSLVERPYPEGLDGTCIQRVQITVKFENLKEIPEFKPGQQIRIYYNETDQDGSLIPYRIEIIDEQEVQQ